MALLKVTKRKRVSKKSKLSWRKHSKVADIEEFLEEQREDERLGGQLKELPNDQLFIIEAKPQEIQISTRQQRKLRALEPLKCFSALQSYTSVKDPIKKRNRVRTAEERKSKLLKPKTKAKELNAIAERRLYEIMQEKKEKRGEFLKDVWNEEKSHSIENDPWAENVTKVHNLRNTGVNVKAVVKEVQKKKSVIPAIEAPHPGTSYNPSFEDHQDLLKIIALEEAKVIKEEKHIKRVTGNMFRKVTQKNKQSEWMVEMSEGLPLNEAVIKEEDEDDIDNIISVINPPKENKKKTLKQRRKQREQLQLQKARKALKMEKKKIGDIHKIKLLEKNLLNVSAKQAKLRDIRRIKDAKDKIKPKMLSSKKYEDPGFDFQLGKEISGNLRTLKKEGNLLFDRFNSLQKRNILVPSKRTHKKAAKVKKFVKSGHKDDWEKTVAK